MSEKRQATVPETAQKAAISVSEMACLCLLSRSRFHALVREGVFPGPVQPAGGRRPYYTQELVQKCLDIRRTGIGQSGEIVLFNRRSGKKPIRQQPAAKPVTAEHPELIESLRALGLTVTGEAVAAAVGALFPGGAESVDQGEVVRKVFLHLQGRRG